MTKKHKVAEGESLTLPAEHSAPEPSPLASFVADPPPAAHAGMWAASAHDPAVRVDGLPDGWATEGDWALRIVDGCVVEAVRGECAARGLNA